jgi:O-acetyl-ADP-ribose deacetylase (regulator of RNase III)
MKHTVEQETINSDGEKSMITYVASSLYTSPAQVLVNTVNTQGVMGKGVAAEFKRIYPKMFEQYRDLCERNEIDIGVLWIYKTPRKWILNFPTKKHWRNPSKPEYIEAGLKKFYNQCADAGIHSIAFPALGCGNGELDWQNTVKPLMEKYLNKLPIDVFIHLPWVTTNPPEHKEQDEIAKWLRSEPASLPFTEVWEDLQEILKGKSHFETFANRSSFSARIAEDQRGVVIETNSKKSTVDYDLLLDFWQQLRRYGYTRRGIVPNGLDREISYLAPIFAQLDYVQPVQLSETDEFESKSFMGLQYIAPPAQAAQNLELFPA